MPRRQPLPLTFIIRAVNRYPVNARVDQFELFLLFRCVADVLFMLSVACFSVDGSALCLAGRLLLPHVSAGRGAYVCIGMYVQYRTCFFPLSVSNPLS